MSVARVDCTVLLSRCSLYFLARSLENILLNSMKTINGGTSSIYNYYSPPRMSIRLVVDFMLQLDLARRTVHCYTLLFSYIQLTWLLTIPVALTLIEL